MVDKLKIKWWHVLLVVIFGLVFYPVTDVASAQQNDIHVAYLYGTRKTYGLDYTNLRLVITDVDGSHRVEITSPNWTSNVVNFSGKTIEGMSWSPDGQILLIYGGNENGTWFEFYDVNGLLKQTLFYPAVLYAGVEWFGNSEEIMFVSSTGREGTGFESYNVLTQESKTVMAGSVYKTLNNLLSISPDSTMFAFLHAEWETNLYGVVSTMKDSTLPFLDIYNNFIPDNLRIITGPGYGNGASSRGIGWSSDSNIIGFDSSEQGFWEDNYFELYNLSDGIETLLKSCEPSSNMYRPSAIFAHFTDKVACRDTSGNLIFVDFTDKYLSTIYHYERGTSLSGCPLVPTLEQLSWDDSIALVLCYSDFNETYVLMSTDGSGNYWNIQPSITLKDGEYLLEVVLS